MTSTSKQLGSGAGPFVIAEVGQNHDGSLGLAHAFIDAVAKTGADAIKFQTHIADAESTPGEPFRVNFSYEDATRYDYWKRMEFTAEQWAGLKRHAEQAGLVFMSSPFSMEAVELLASLDVEAWKVGSGEIGSRRMMARMIETGRHIFVSTGMSGFAEIDGVVDFLRGQSADFTLFQCTTAYPSSAEQIGLNVMHAMATRYGCPVGLSDHTGEIWPCIAASTLGASALEVHVTLSREMFGPDIAASLTMDDLRRLVDGSRYIRRMTANPVDKDALAQELLPLRRMFGKGAVARRDLAAGSEVGWDDVSFKKPSGGIAEIDFDTFKGRRLQRPVGKGIFLKPEDFGQ